MDREAFADYQRAIRAEAAAQVRETVALRAQDAMIRRDMEAMRALASPRPAPVQPEAAVREPTDGP